MAALTCIRTAKKEGQTYEDFLESRKAGFGGSDIGDLLDSEPYGCRRRLFLSRLGLLPDDGNNRLKHHLERGKFFEAPIAQLYAERTGREVKECGTGYLKQFPFVRANADRLVRYPEAKEFAKKSDGSYLETRGWGVLEIKVPAAWSFKKIKKEGLPEAYILQLQWQMLCYGTSWGSFAVYWPDGHELLWFDVERDEALIQMLFERAQTEWRWLDVFQKFERHEKTLENLFADSAFPGAKPSSAPACQNCPNFEGCHGFAIPDGVILKCPELEPTAERYSDLVREIKRLEDEKEGIKDALKAEFAKFPAEKLNCGRFDVGLREQTRESLDPAVKKELDEAQIVRYTKRTSYQVLTVKEAKK